jgi:hypothetical protein
MKVIPLFLIVFYSTCIYAQKNIKAEPYLDSISGMYGFKNNEKEIIQPIYDFATAFINGLSKVTIDSLYGYVNEKGKEILECQFTHISKPYNGIILAKDSTWVIINDRGEGLVNIDKQSFNIKTLTEKTMTGVEGEKIIRNILNVYQRNEDLYFEALFELISAHEQAYENFVRYELEILKEMEINVSD